MRARQTVLALVVGCALAASVHAAPNGPAVVASVASHVPLVFVQNQGQFEADVRFAAASSRLAIVSSAGDVTLRAAVSSRLGDGDPLTVRWLGSAREGTLAGERQVEHGITYIAGRDPRQWHPAVPAFHRVRWTGAYPGIDVLFYGTNGEVEYDLVVAPGADPSRVRLAFDGASELHVDTAGNLVIETSSGRLVQHAPLAWQLDADSEAERRPVEAHYVIDQDGGVRIELGSRDASKALTIDPVLTFATIIGGSGSEDTNGVSVDGQGNVYVLANASSSDYPARWRTGATSGPAVAVTKLSPLGDEILYSSIVVGTESLRGVDLFVDSAGAAYVAGLTSDASFPVVNAFQPTCHARPASGGQCSVDAFVFKLAPDGTDFEFSTYLGGGGYEDVTGISVDSSGHPIVVGGTDSDDFPLHAAVQNHRATCPTCDSFAADAFITKLAPDGASLVFSTYLGGGAQDRATDVAVSAADVIHVAGESFSDDFPYTIHVANDAPPGSIRSFVVLFWPGGFNDYITLVDGLEFPHIKVDGAGRVHLAAGESGKVFAGVLNDTGSLVWQGVFGGSDGDRPLDIALGPGGTDFIVGVTYSNDFPQVAPLQGRASYPLRRSTDRGVGFEIITGIRSPVASMAFDPVDSTIVYAGTSGSGVYFSKDAGRTWSERSNGLGSSPHVTSVALQHESPLTVFAVVDDQLYTMAEFGAGSAWRQVPVLPASLPPPQRVSTVLVDPFIPNKLYAGTTDGLYTSLDDGATWTRAFMAEPVGITLMAADQQAPGVLFAVATGISRGVWKSVNGGTTWRRVFTVSPNRSVPSLVVDPANGLRLYVTIDGGFFYTSQNGGETWVPMSHPGVPDDLAMDRTGRLYMIASSRLYVLPRADATFQEAGFDLPPTLGFLAVSFADPSLVFVSTSGGTDGFIAQVEPFVSVPGSPGAASLRFASPLGGTSDDRIDRIATRADGVAYLAGTTSSDDMFTTSRIMSTAQAEYVSAHVFVARVDANADGDGDGMPTDWELQVGLDPSVADAGADPDGDGRTNLEEYQAGTHPRGVQAQYLAEGATSTFFDTQLAFVNPDATSLAHVLLRFLRPQGAAIQAHVLVPPRTRRTLDVKDVAGMSTAEFSTVIESDVPIAAARVMSWDARAYGAHSEIATAAPAATWYFAEGATHSGFQLFYLLENPNDVAVTVDATYLPADRAPVTQRYDLAPGTRLTVWGNFVPGLASAEFGAIFAARDTRPILVERAMYLDTAGQTFGAGHEAAGATAPSLTWHFAEGATGSYFDTFLLLGNPTAYEAEVAVQYLLPNGDTFANIHSVPAFGRRTVWVDSDDPRLADTAVAMKVTSNGVPIIAERAMWWPGPTAATWYEAHCASGATTPAAAWAVADGAANGPRSAETYVLVSNPSDTDAEVHVTLMLEDGSLAERDLLVPAYSRTNISVNAGAWTFDTPSGLSAFAQGTRFGMIVESVGAAVPIVVESAVYWDMYTGDGQYQRWAAGTAALATRIK